VHLIQDIIEKQTKVRKTWKFDRTHVVTEFLPVVIFRK